MQNQSLITLSSDFEKQSYGCGAMEGVIYQINPGARVVHHTHGIQGFNLFQAAYTMETLTTMPVGIHVCVVDPGVGTRRRAIAIQVGRGDTLIGPDNGVLSSAARLLGGIQIVHELTNPKYQRQPVSPIFHGRDIFATAAGHLSTGVPLQEFGPRVQPADLAPAPYGDAVVVGNKIEAVAIEINRFGTATFNILQKEWDRFGVPFGDQVILRRGDSGSRPGRGRAGGSPLRLTHTKTFGEVEIGKPCILKDDFTRVEAAINQGSLVKEFPVKIGDQITIIKHSAVAKRF